MKIAMIGQKGIPAHGGGIERHVEELSVRLAKAGCEVFVYSRKYYTKYDKDTYKGVKLIYLPCIRSKHLEAISHTFLATLDALRRGFDIIHYHGVGPSTLSFIPRLFLRNTKVISTFHCRDRFHQKWGRIARAYLSFGEFASCKFPHQTICVSETIQKFAKNKFGKNNLVDFIPNGVSPVEESDKEIDEGILKNFGLEKNKYILAVSRLIPHKGIHYLIEAFKNLNKVYKFKDFKLAIVGDGSFTDDYVIKLKEQAKDCSNIIFCGFHEGQSLAALYRGAFLFVHPSEAEGLPLCVLEAMSFGKAVLVSNIPENIEACGGFGFVFTNKDVTDLTYKLRLLLASPDLIKSTGQGARNFALQKYNWDRIVEKTIGLYENILIKKPIIECMGEKIIS